MVLGEVSIYCVACQEVHKPPVAVAVNDRRCRRAEPWIVLDPPSPSTEEA